MSDDTHLGELLPDLLDAQAQLLACLIDLGHQQVEAIQNGRMNELLSILSRKQQFLDALAANALRLGPISNQLELGDALTPPQRAGSREKHALATARFDELFELEKHCEQLLCDSRTQIAGRLEQTVHSMNVAKAYRRESLPPTQGGRLDLSSSS